MDSRSEFIGRVVRLGSKRIVGEIIDETKNLFILKMGNNRKKIQKKGNNFHFSLKGKNVIIDGEKLILRSEDRIKLKG